MTYFPTLTPNVKRQLTGFFDELPAGAKLKKGFKLFVPSQKYLYDDYTLKNSFIKLNGGVYAIATGPGAVLGKGAYGRVKFVQSLATNESFVVKILACKLSNLGDINHEVDVLRDVGLFQDAGIKPAALKTLSTDKYYIVMQNLGLSLDYYLTLHPNLTLDERFSLAIKCCWAVHSLHSGFNSISRKAYAHRDLKPANIAIDEGEKVRLIDMGLSDDKPDSLPTYLSGTPYYLPSFSEAIRTNLRQLDVLALKRVLFMPKQMICSHGYVEDRPGRGFNCRMLFTNELLKLAGLYNYIDTSSSPNTPMPLNPLPCTPLTLCALLVLGRYGLVGRYASSIIRNQFLAYIVIGTYFENEKASMQALSHLIDNAICSYRLHKVVPRHNATFIQLKLLELMLQLGLINNLTNAKKNESLIDTLQNASETTKQAAVLLWQNDYCDADYFDKLKADQKLAKLVVQLAFARNWPMLSAVLPNTHKKPETSLTSVNAKKIPLKQPVYTALKERPTGLFFRLPPRVKAKDGIVHHPKPWT